MLTKNAIKVTLFLITFTWLISCQKDDRMFQQFKDPKMPMDNGFAENDVVLLWNENISKVLSKTPIGPPILSRHYTMSQLAIHDALNSIIPKYRTYALLNTRVKTANPEAAVASAAYWTLRNIDVFLKTFPPFTVGLPLQASGNDWDAWYASALRSIPDGPSKEEGIALGKTSADAIMAKRADDNYALARFVYIPVPPFTPAPGTWRPTISKAPVPLFHEGGLALWATYMKPFGVERNDQFRPGPAPDLLSNEYTNAFNEVKGLGARTGSTRTAEQTILANYWQENSQLIWNRFARQAILNKKMDAWRSARLLALVNISIFDGLLTSFDGLYFYKVWRPESAIRLADTDGNPGTTPDAEWVPFVTDIKIGPGFQTPTPPIPEYPNPNAALGTAVAEILSLYFETDKTNVNLVTQDVTLTGMVRQYQSFSFAAKEFAESRIYAGFNFRFSIDAGNKLGQQLAKYVFENNLREN